MGNIEYRLEDGVLKLVTMDDDHRRKPGLMRTLNNMVVGVTGLTKKLKINGVGDTSSERRVLKLKNTLPWA